MPTVGPRKTARTNRRLARARTRRPGVLQNIEADSKYTPREVRRVRKVDARIRRQDAKKAAAKAKRRAATKYDPLAPLTGPRAKAELDAATRLQYGDTERALRNETASREEDVARQGTYYDDYRQKLREASARVNEANRQNIEAQEGRVDTAFAQDTARTTAADASASEQAAKLGRGPVVTPEGHQAASAQRVTGDSDIAMLRSQAATQNERGEMRAATALLGKANATERAAAKVNAAKGRQTELAKEKGAFRVKTRADQREGEREWAAIQKEFGLKKQELKQDSKTSRADRKLENSKLRTQRIVARIYAAGDAKSAQAQIRVAKLQLEKGKIDQSQYRHIVNEYRGLPKKGKSGGQGGGGSQTQGVGSGKDGSLAPWEKDKISNAIVSLKKTKAGLNDQRRAIDALVARGVPKRLARIAWRKYIKQQNQAVNQSPGGDANQR